MRKQKAIRVGVVGVGRGQTFMRSAAPANMELVAICDIWKERLHQVGRALKVATYADYDRFLEHDMDAVVLANYYHEHAPFAVKALDAGCHVMSECAACLTPAEGVALVRAVERTKKIYMFAENYPYSACNQEMRRLYQGGQFGKFIYGEGEYVHPDPPDVTTARSCGYNHWRNWLPWGSYYCTHAVAPVMFITDTRPVSVSAFVMPYDFDDPDQTGTVRRTDVGAALMLKMDNGAIVKALQGSLRGHGNFVRIHGNRGLMENCRHGDKGYLRVWRETWEKNPGEPVETVYKPDFPIHHDLAMKAGHGGGDFFTSFHFAEAIRSGRQPYLDVYRGLAMTLCGIQGWKSALAGGAPMEVPDFRKKAVQKKYENDNFTVDPLVPGHVPASVLGDIQPTRQAMAFSRAVWRRQGYRGK
jgi:predicted dehydrogenase